jgi:hypothetical protein
MNTLLKIETVPAFNAQSFDDAVRSATIRAQHSFFDQHIIEQDDGSYLAIDEGDYNALPIELIDRIAHTVQGMMADEFDADPALAAALISVAIDPDWDDDVPF